MPTKISYLENNIYASSYICCGGYIKINEKITSPIFCNTNKLGRLLFPFSTDTLYLS